MAASFLGKLLVKIEGDNSDLDKSIGKSEGSVKKFSKFAVAAYAAVGVALIAVGKKFSKLAASAEEIRSKFNVVFGKTAKAVNEWASEYSKSVGRSETDTLSFLGSIGDLLKPLGFTKDAVDNLSKTVVTLANDLGSFNDMPTEDVMRDIQSAMVGNFEVTKKYGVVLNEAVIKQEAFNRGLFDGKGVVDAQVKAQIALDLIIKGTTDAQGDLLRTQESNTNTMIRLSSATKDLGIELGGLINEGVTPLAGGMATLISKFAEWVKKTKEVDEVLKELRGEGKSTVVEVEALQNAIGKLNDDIARAEKLREGRGDTIGMAAIERMKNERALLQEQFDIAKQIETAQIRTAALEKQFANEITAANEEELRLAKIKEEQLKFTAERIRLQAELGAEFDRVDELGKLGLVDAELEKQKALRETLNDLIEFGFTAEGAGVANVIGFAERRNVLLEDEKILIEDLDEGWTNFNQTVTGDLEGQSTAIKQLEIDWESLTENGLGAFASTFKQMGEEGVTIWDTLKQAGKNAVSSVLEGLAQEALVRAALAFAIPFGVGIPSGIAYTAAAAAAFAGSGLVQNLAEGGVLAPATGGVPAVMAEAGVPEMAMPLNSAATDPFADKIASRINSSTTNNTQNFNSMFSLNDENKMREAARRLFPFMRDEELRRGITV